MKLVTVAEMQAAERECGIPIPQLMENAGLAFASAVKEDLGDVKGRRVLVLVGPGNNGGDGLVAARHFHDWGASVQVYLLQPRRPDDPVFRHVQERDIQIIDATEDSLLSYQGLQRSLDEADAIVDALLGTGASRPIQGVLADILQRLKEARGPTPARPGSIASPPRLFALDLPSGANPDSGTVDPLTVPADFTVSFQWPKAGLVIVPASRYTGRLLVADIGIPQEFSQRLTTELLDAAWARDRLPARPDSAHKGTFGRVAIVAGSPHYIGAAHLSTMAALRVGAGIATLACARSVYPLLASRLLEPTFFPLKDEEGFLSAKSADDLMLLLREGVDTLLVGPGLGQDGYVRAFIRALLMLMDMEASRPRALVLDADGLNNLSRIDRWPELLTVPAVLTPHPGEMSRLCGLTVAEIQADRLAIARRFAVEWKVVLVLKGANTVIASPDGYALISPFANPALASGGTGDVLAGAIAGLLAQGLDTFTAAALGVYLHGLAAQRLSDQFGSAGLLAGDLLPELPRTINHLSSPPEPQP